MSLIPPTLRTARLLLRPFTPEDADALFAMHANAHVMRYVNGAAWKDRASADQFLALCKQFELQGTGTRLAIESTGGVFQGWCGLVQWNPAFRSASLGYCLNETAWGQGFATEAAGALLQWAFDTLDVNRIQAQANTRNLPSARILEKLGFVHEGTQREDCIVDGVVSDSWVYGLLRREWNPVTLTTPC